MRKNLKPMARVIFGLAVWSWLPSAFVACILLADGPNATPPRFLLAWGKEGTAHGEFEFPIGIAIHEQTIFVTDHYNNRVQAFEFDTNGKLLGGLQAGQGSEPGKFFAPHTLAFNHRGEFFVVDSYNHRIQKFATGK